MPEISGNENAQLKPEGRFKIHLPFFGKKSRESRSQEIPSPIRVTHEVLSKMLYSKLTEQDRQNLADISEKFRSKLASEGLQGGLLVVGGILEKQLPRKDIDVRAVLETGDKRDNYPTYLEYAENKFKRLQVILSAIADEIPGTRIAETLEPTMDEEFQNPSVLKHEGTIKMGREGTTPVEFLNTIDGTMRSEIARQTRPYVILAEVA